MRLSACSLLAIASGTRSWSEPCSFSSIAVAAIRCGWNIGIRHARPRAQSTCDAIVAIVATSRCDDATSGAHVGSSRLSARSAV